MKKLNLDELGRMSLDEFRNAAKLPVCILLDHVRSLHNVGSAFRTADAFRIDKIFLTGITGKPPHRDIEKTALGATSSVTWEYAEDSAKLTSRLKKEGWKVVVVEQTNESTSLQDFRPESGEKICLVFGNEVDGVSDEILAIADAAIEVPQSGTKHSLNISVCLGIVCWEIFKKTALEARGYTRDKS